MTKHEVTLKLSISGQDDDEANKFLGDLEEIIERASSRGFKVTVSSGGTEVAVLNEYDPMTYIAEDEIEPDMVPHVKSFVRPSGVRNGTFIYRKDSVAMLRVRMKSVLRTTDILSI